MNRLPISHFHDVNGVHWKFRIASGFVWHTKCKCRLPLPLHSIELFHKVPKVLPTIEYNPPPVSLQSAKVFLSKREKKMVEDFSLFNRVLFYSCAPCTFLLSALPVTFNVIVLWRWLCYINVLHYKTKIEEKQNHLVFVVFLRVDPLL